MIRSWGNEQTRDVFIGRFVRGMAHEIQRRAEIKLKRLDAAASLDDMMVPASNRLEKLRAAGGRWSIRINDQWRITFDWIENDAYNVLIQDYH